MYLHELHIVNDGPIRQMSVQFTFDASGRPKPVVLVGENGSGKTNVLSIVADALAEGAAQHHSDILPHQGVSRSWFRIVGGLTTTFGTSGGFALLKFQHGEDPLVYRQKSGAFAASDIPEYVSEVLRAGSQWPAEGSFKEFPMSEEQCRTIFKTGAYAFFPASRSEPPHWLNADGVPSPSFDFKINFAGRLGKPIFVERGIARLAQWIPSVLLDSRPGVSLVDGNFVIDNSNPGFVSTQPTLQLLNLTLQTVLDDTGATFYWPSRTRGLQFYNARSQRLLPLAALSSGQSTLLSIFGTLIAQCDSANPGNPSATSGICVIDEIDAHVHIDLAYRALPKLIASLPNIQFITSAHSPLYVLGMQSMFEDKGVDLLELPSGRLIDAEGYSEFTSAVDVLRNTQAFDAMLSERLLSASKPLILCEGETDPRYIVAAAKLLAREDVLDGLAVEWIGSRKPLDGSSVGAGKDSLKRAWQLLSLNPEISSRPIMLLFDNDARQSVQEVGKTYARVVPTNEANHRMTSGIENLLSEAVFTEDMYESTTKDEGNGKQVTVKLLRKMKLCNYLCDEKQLSDDFSAFSPLLDLIAKWKVDLLRGEPRAENDAERRAEVRAGLSPEISAGLNAENTGQSSEPGPAHAD